MAKKSAHRLARELARSQGLPDPGPLKAGMYRQLICLAPIKLADAIDEIWGLVEKRYAAQKETYSNFLLDLLAAGMVVMANAQREAIEKQQREQKQEELPLVQLAGAADLPRYVGRR